MHTEQAEEARGTMTPQDDTLIGTTAKLGLAAMLSRVLGFVRDMSMAWLLGGTLAADALALALRLPNVLRRLLGEGALSMSLTADLVLLQGSSSAAASPPTSPPTSSCSQKAQPLPSLAALSALHALTRAVGLRLALLLGLATLLGLLLAPELAYVLAPGQSSPLTSAAVPLLRLTLPYAFFAGMAALGMAALHALGRFLLPALLPAFFNITVLFFACLAALKVAPPALLLALGVFCGGLVQCLVQWISLRPLWRPQTSGSTCDPDAAKGHITDTALLRQRAKQCLSRLPLAVLGAAAPQLAMLGGMVAASWLSSGSLAALYYAERLMELPLGVAGAALGIASLPALTRLVAEKRHHEAGLAASRALRLSLAVTLPATAGLLAVALPLVQTLFARGAFDGNAVTATTLALMGYAPGLPAYGLTRPLLALCHATGRTRLSAVSGAVCVGLALPLAFVLVHVFPPHLALLGPPLGVTLALWGQAVLLFFALKGPPHGKPAALRLSLPCKNIVQHTLAALATGLAAYGVSLSVSHPALGLLLAVPAGVLACVFCLALMNNAEWGDIRQGFRRKRA